MNELMWWSAWCLYSARPTWRHCTSSALTSQGEDCVPKPVSLEGVLICIWQHIFSLNTEYTNECLIGNRLKMCFDYEIHKVCELYNKYHKTAFRKTQFDNPFLGAICKKSKLLWLGCPYTTERYFFLLQIFTHQWYDTFFVFDTNCTCVGVYEYSTSWVVRINAYLPVCNILHIVYLLVVIAHWNPIQANYISSKEVDFWSYFHHGGRT